MVTHLSKDVIAKFRAQVSVTTMMKRVLRRFAHTMLHVLQKPTYSAVAEKGTTVLTASSELTLPSSIRPFQSKRVSLNARMAERVGRGRIRMPMCKSLLISTDPSLDRQDSTYLTTRTLNIAPAPRIMLEFNVNIPWYHVAKMDKIILASMDQRTCCQQCRELGCFSGDRAKVLLLEFVVTSQMRNG